MSVQPIACVCDLAKLFTCSVPLDMLLAGDGSHAARIPRRGPLAMGTGEKRLLEEYRGTLLARRSSPSSSFSPPEYPWETFVRHWEAALVDWCRFQASWGFWGNTEWLQARVRSILADEGWREWLLREVSS